MKGRVIFTALLALVFCFTAVFPISAAQQPTAKELMLTALKNFDLGVDKGFYEKSWGEANLEVAKFEGSLQEQLGDFAGAKIKLITQLDDAKNAIRLGYNTDIKSKVTEGELYIIDDKVILTKDIFNLMQDLGFNPLENSEFMLSELPEYLYAADPQLKTVWEQMATYQNQQLPDEYMELLLFVVEAIPEKYFNLSTTKATIQLDQDGLVDTIVNLLTKMTKESDRVAEILISTNQYSFKQMGLDPAEMKQEIASQLASMTVPTREEIMVIASLIEVRDFTFEYSLLPGGPKKFNVDLGFNAPDNSVQGAFKIAVDAQGKQGNLEGAYRITGNYNDLNGPAVDVALASKYRYTETVYHSDLNASVTVKDNKTGELLLDLGLVGDSVSEVDKDLVLNVPVLTSNNSMDMTDLISTLGPSITPEQPGELGLNLVVNGVNLEAKPKIASQGEMMLPARAVLEQLGYQVEWIEPDEIQVASEDIVISLFIKQTGFTVNGAEKSLTVAPYTEAGRAMVPLSFIISELDVRLEFVERYMVLTN